MSQPFYAAANRVICMYERRQERSSEQAPAHSMAEIHLVCKTLSDIALSATYTAHLEEAAEIMWLIANWPKGEVPALFPEVTKS